MLWHKLFRLPRCNCDLATVTNANGNIWYPGYLKCGVATRRLRTTAVERAGTHLSLCCRPLWVAEPDHLFCSVFLWHFTCPGSREEAHILKSQCSGLNSGFSRRPEVGLAPSPGSVCSGSGPSVFLLQLSPKLLPGGFDRGGFFFLTIYPHKSMWVAIQDLKTQEAFGAINSIHPPGMLPRLHIPLQTY